METDEPEVCQMVLAMHSVKPELSGGLICHSPRGGMPCEVSTAMAKTFATVPN